MENSFRKVDRWGISFNPLRMHDFIEIIDKHLSTKSDRPLHITGVNPETIVRALGDSRLLHAIQDSDLVNIDNAFVLLMLRLSGVKAPERIATPDLFENMLSLAYKRNYSVYLLGAKQEILSMAVDNIKSQYYGIRIAGYRNGFFSEEDIPEICNEIQSTKPSMLFVALPTPAKELFIQNYKHSLDVPVLLGVGGAIDIKAGLVTRAPNFLKNHGLEGIHRAMQNPMNYGKRYLLYPAFVHFVIKEQLKRSRTFNI